MTEPLAYLNGRLLPQSQAHLTLHDAGFVLGATVTDLCRTYNHRLFRWPDHLRRFRASCEAALVPQPPSDEELTRLAEQIVTHNARLLGPGQDLALVLFATPGPVGYYLGEPGGPGDGPPTLGIHTFPSPLARYAHLFTTGARLVIPTIRHVGAACVDPRIKHRSRLHWWLADRRARLQEPGASALLLDTQGYVTETAAANFLLVRGGAVLCPRRSTILAGISLQVTQELCLDLGIAFQEENLTVAACLGADEALLTGTSFGLAGVSRINDHALAWPGAVYQRLLAAWCEAAGTDIASQFLAAR
jgi:branched-chain amino acid aminotransferase